jgi:hypothetical protein
MTLGLLLELFLFTELKLVKDDYHKPGKWGRDDLHGKTVEFDIVYKEGRVIGLGKFFMRGSPHWMQTEIEVEKPKETASNFYKIPPDLENLIEPHPNPKVADFRLVGRFESSE